jgi:thiol-disulfide isomerase/thioredoxin
MALGCLCAAVLAVESSKASGSGVPVAAREPVLLDLDGNRKTLDDFRGKVLLINFWASWCPPCIREMPELEALAGDMATQPFRVVMVNVEEPPGVMRRFNRLPEAGIVSLRDSNGQFARDWGVTVYPTSFVVDREGHVVERFVGPADWTSAAWMAGFERLLPALRTDNDIAPSTSD